MMSKNLQPCSSGIKKLFSLFGLFLGFASFSFAQNPIVTENLKAGTPQSVWDVPSNGDGTYGDATIVGFANAISYSAGQTVDFRVSVTSGANKNFTITIYRLGYYGGNGATQVAVLPGPISGITQAAPLGDGTTGTSETGLNDYGNWTVSASWTIPAGSVSGLYIARLSRTITPATGSIIPFVVRNDASNSDLYFKTSDATWQAYNDYGGNSLYVGALLPNDHASKISYNRPFITRNGGGGGGSGEDWFMNAEYPMIRFLESNGYDISYTTDVDVAKGSLGTNHILQHKVFLSVGHDEYWSKEERNQVEAARAAGVNLAFFSGNEVYWKTRWENSIDGTGTAFRTMVCYKEGAMPTVGEHQCGDKCDVSTNEWTGLWRDGCGYAGVTDACKPENALSGQISWDGNSGTMEVPDTYKNLRFWRNTRVAALTTGQIATMTPGTLGYEWDWEQFQSSYPSGRITMSNTSLDGHTHKLSLYRSTGGGLVFGAGTVQWAWGLDKNHDNGSANADPAMQQATINLLADMGAQPGTLQSGLTAAAASTDVTAPVTSITSPANGASLPENNLITITGTAVDATGVVAGVDVSVDGGTTWKPAVVASMDGSTTWTFSWTATSLGTATIMSRGFDDSGNMESAGGSEGSSNTVNVTIVAGTPPTGGPFSIFTPDQGPTNPADFGNDGEAITMGTKFRAAFDGVISGIRFYQSPDDHTADHIVQLWDPANPGAPLAQASQSAPTFTGWNTINFATPVPISANVIYIAAFYSSSGEYSETPYVFLDGPVVRGPLTALQENDPDGDGPNSVFKYDDGDDGPDYPDQGYEASNYWVDVEYTPNGAGPDNTPPTVALTSPTNLEGNVNVNRFVSITFSENIDPATVNSSNIEFKDAGGNVVPATISYSSGSRTATLTPSSFLSFSATYTVTVKGGGVTDLSGNALVADYTFSFTTAAAPAVPPDAGAGGPVLIISDVNSPFSRYPVEILRAQGYTAFKALDISEVRGNWTSLLSTYDVVILGHMTLTADDIANLTTWTMAGGTLIALRPDAGLLPLMGVTATGTTVGDGYLLVNTTSGFPGAGIVNATIQYHGNADLYNLGTATSLATLYATATTARTNPAVTTKSVGANGGKAIAFAYDLAASIVYTRQGNPLYEGHSRDGQPGPIRSDNLFFPDYVDFSKIAIPQADEQQHLLTNIILQSNLHRMPLPHLWFLPNGYKAAVVMTGDDHNVVQGATETRFNEYMGLGPNTPADVADWKAIRGTSYVYAQGVNIPDASIANYQSQGFEIALHPTTNCTDFTETSLSSDISSQMSQLQSERPSLLAPVTNRTHCMPWSDWSTHAKVESALGMRFDVNYYYWPDTWVQDRPGMFTGSGMPMRFSALNGTLIDVYQAPTQIPDESGLDISSTINTLLNNATNPSLGYYGVFVANMHMEQPIHPGSDAITSAAISKGIPVVSAKQMLTWLDNRNNTVFGSMTWTNDTKLSFTINTSAHNLQAMVPMNSDNGTLQSVEEGGNSIGFTPETVKGIAYGVFPASTNSYVATYTSTPLPITLLSFTATKQGTSYALLKWTTSMESNNKGFEIQRSTDASSWTDISFVAGAGNSQTKRDYQYTDKDLANGTYYYRLQQTDFDGKTSFSKIVSVTITGALSLELLQNRPNPFTGSTTIEMIIPQSCRVQLILYDQMGRPVQQLMDEVKAAGKYQVDLNKNGLSSGTYYYKLNAMGKSLVRKMTIL